MSIGAPLHSGAFSLKRRQPVFDTELDGVLSLCLRYTEGRFLQSGSQWEDFTVFVISSTGGGLQNLRWWKEMGHCFDTV